MVREEKTSLVILRYSERGLKPALHATAIAFLMVRSAEPVSRAGWENRPKPAMKSKQRE